MTHDIYNSMYRPLNSVGCPLRVVPVTWHRWEQIVATVPGEVRVHNRYGDGISG